METNTTYAICEACDEPILEEGSYMVGADQNIYHDSCWSAEFDYASKVWVTEGAEPYQVLVCSHGTYDAEYLEGYDGPLEIERTWHQSDGWRGYYETRVTNEGWSEVDSGWTTGNWGDYVSDSKQDFNAWSQALIAGLVTLPEGLTVVLAFDPTSNVFSTAAGVFTNDADLFAQALSVPEGL